MHVSKIINKVAVAAVLTLSLDAMSNVRTGSYVGVNAGYLNLNPNTKVTDNIANNLEPRITKKKNAMQVNVFAGYEKVCTPSFILGGELALGTEFSPTKFQYSADAGADRRQLKTHQAWKIGAYGLVGTPMNDRVTLYGKLGLLYSRFDTKFYGSSNFISGVGSNDYRLLGTQKNNLWGIEPGVRIKMALNENWATQLDGSYAWYQSKKTTLYSENNVSVNGKQSPRLWGVTLGLSRKF